MTVAKPCMGGDEAAAGSRRQIECLDRERLVWDKMVNDSYKTMMNAFEPDQQTKLREMQRSWIHTRDLTCAFWYDYFQGTMANPMIALQQPETARRAIFLQVLPPISRTEIALAAHLLDRVELIDQRGDRFQAGGLPGFDPRSIPAPLHSIISSARDSSADGKERSSAFAVLRLIRRSNLVGW